MADAGEELGLGPVQLGQRLGAALRGDQRGQVGELLAAQLVADGVATIGEIARWPIGPRGA